MKADSLGARCKRYEATSRQVLVPRTPVLARIDGRAFHTFCRGLAKPYDADFHACMWTAAMAVCKDVAGAKLAYVQSDEISLLVTDYESLGQGSHFDYEVPKLCSTMAATTSVAFLAEFYKRFPDRATRMLQTGRGLPTFDARVFNVPREDVCNALTWRQRDAERNSLTMHAQAHYSASELHGQGKAAKHDLLHEKGINWSHLPTPRKRGVCVVRETYEVPKRRPSIKTTGSDAEWVMNVIDQDLNPVEGTTTRTRWVVDEDIPIFSTPEGRQYVERFVWPDRSGLDESV
jgi:tRNA(His) guanylyltransferase